MGLYEILLLVFGYVVSFMAGSEYQKAKHQHELNRGKAIKRWRDIS